MNKKLLAGFVAILFMVGMASVASATLLSVEGGVIITNSWQQHFSIGSGHHHDKLEVNMESSHTDKNDKFEALDDHGGGGFSDFNNISWGVTEFSSDHLKAEGNTSADEENSFALNFEGSHDDDKEFTIKIYDGDDLLEEDTAHWDGDGGKDDNHDGVGDGEWDIHDAHDCGNNEHPTNPVPEPGTFFLIGGGLVGLFFARKKLS